MNSKLTARFEDNKLTLEVYKDVYVLDMTKEQYDQLVPVLRHIYRLGHRDGYNTSRLEHVEVPIKRKQDPIGSTAGLFAEALGLKLLF